RSSDLAFGDAGGELGTAGAFLDGVVDLVGSFAGRLGCALGKVANLLGDHGEAGTCFTGTGCLDGGIERENVGLEGDLVDGLDDLGDVVGGGLDIAHGGD